MENNYSVTLDGVTVTGALPPLRENDSGAVGLYIPLPVGATYAGLPVTGGITITVKGTGKSASAETRAKYARVAEKARAIARANAASAAPVTPVAAVQARRPDGISEELWASMTDAQRAAFA